MDIATLQTELMTAIESADTLDALETVRIAALGKQGSVSALLKTMGGMSPEERQTQGPIINGLRESVTAALAAKKLALETADLNRRLASEQIDMTLPAPETPRGTVHPVSQVMDELAEIFADMGFALAEGPEIEDDWHNFTALNIPETHASVLNAALIRPFWIRASRSRQSWCWITQAGRQARSHGRDKRQLRRATFPMTLIIADGLAGWMYYLRSSVISSKGLVFR